MNRQLYTPRQFKEHGLSLIELMIAISLGILIIGVILGIFVSGNRNYAQDERFARTQENARFAMKAFLSDISTADFWGGVIEPNGITVAPGVPATVCNIAMNGLTALDGVTNETAANITTKFPCITTAKPNTSALAIKRVLGSCLAAAGDTVFAPKCTTTAPLEDHLYLRVTGTQGRLLAATSSTVVAIGERYWEFIPRIYYIRRFAVNDGDGIPTLVRKELRNVGGTWNMTDVALVEGIENFVVANGTPSSTDAPLPIQVHLLARSLDRDFAYDVNLVDTKTFRLGAACFNTTGADGCIQLQTTDNHPHQYYRRVFTSTVAARNPGILASFQ